MKTLPIAMLWMISVAVLQAQESGGTRVTALTAEDRAGIQELAGSYAAALGRCAAEEYAALFVTPDGYFASGTAGKVVGHKKLAELVLGQTHCINGTAIGGGPPPTAGARRPSSGPGVTIETTPAGITGRATLRDHGHYEDVYVKTPAGWRFKSRTHLSAAQEQAGLTAQDYEDIRKLAGTATGKFQDVYASTPKGPRFKSAGLIIEPSPEGATGKASLPNGGGRYEDVYVKGAAGWRFKSRTYAEK